MCHCYPSCENKSFLIPTEGNEGKNYCIFHQINERVSEANEWDYGEKYNSFWLSDWGRDLKAFIWAARVTLAFYCWWWIRDNSISKLSATVDIRFFTISAFWNEFYVKLSIVNFGTWQKQQNVDALSQSHPSHLCPSQNQNIRLSEAEARYS